MILYTLASRALWTLRTKHMGHQEGVLAQAAQQKPCLWWKDKSLCISSVFPCQMWLVEATFGAGWCWFVGWWAVWGSEGQCGLRAEIGLYGGQGKPCASPVLSQAACEPWVLKLAEWATVVSSALQKVLGTREMHNSHCKEMPGVGVGGLQIASVVLLWGDPAEWLSPGHLY